MLTIFHAENHIQKFTIHSTQVNTFHVISSWLLTSPSEQRSKAGCSLLPWRYQKSPENRNNEKSSEIKSFTFELLQKYDKSRDSLSNSGSRTPINSTRLSNLFWTANHHFWKHWLLPGDSASWWLDITDSSKIRSRSTSSWMLESSSCWGALRGCDWCICWYTMRKTMKNSADEMMQDRTIIPVVPKSKALIHWCSWRITAVNQKIQKGLSPLPNYTWLDWRNDVFMESWNGAWGSLGDCHCQISIPKLWCWMLNTVSKSTAASDSERHSAILNGHQCPFWPQNQIRCSSSRTLSLLSFISSSNSPTDWRTTDASSRVFPWSMLTSSLACAKASLT